MFVLRIGLKNSGVFRTHYFFGTHVFFPSNDLWVYVFSSVQMGLRGCRDDFCLCVTNDPSDNFAGKVNLHKAGRSAFEWDYLCP